MKKVKENVKEQKEINRISTRYSLSSKIKDSRAGITLIALVISIIVLLILAGVTIATLTGENGIFIQAQKAKEETTEAEAIERIQVEVLSSYGADGNIDINLLKENLNNIQGIEGVDNIAKLPTVITLGGKDYRIKNDGKVGKYESELPRGYTELEYIESTGTQYIDTNYTIQDLPIAVETSFELTSIVPQNLFGTNYPGNGRYFVPYLTSNSFYYDKFRLEPAYVANWYDVSFVQSSKDLSVMEIKINDNKYSVKTTISSFPINNGYQVFIAGNRFYAYYKCKYHRLYENNNMVFNLIPALDPSGTPCMYDTISKQTFYNQGTGEFLYKEKEL